LPDDHADTADVINDSCTLYGNARSDSIP